MEAPQFHSIFPSPMFSGAWNGFFFAWITCMVFFLTWNPLLSEMVFFLMEIVFFPNPTLGWVLVVVPRLRDG